MSKTTICVLGGGIGGVVAAGRLKKYLGDTAKVILIDKSADHWFQPSLLWVLSGYRKPEQIRRPLSRLNRRGIESTQATVTKIDPENNLIYAGDQQIRYDYLVIALGAESDLAAVEGLKEAAIDLYSLEGILRLKEEIAAFNGGEVAMLIPSKPYKCPAAPYETAFLLDAAFRRRQMRDKVNLGVFTFETLPMAAAGPKIGQAVKGFVEQRDIGYNPQVAIESVDPETKELLFSDGTKKAVDLLITIPPHKAAEVVKAAGLTNEAGWIPVDPKTLKTKYDNIWAIGDVAAVKLAGKYKPDKPLMLPKAGVFAHGEAEVVAANIAAIVKDKAADNEFDGHGSCFLELGDGTAGYAVGSFYDLPHPNVNMKKPARRFRLYKVLFEKYWFQRWF